MDAHPVAAFTEGFLDEPAVSSALAEDDRLLRRLVAGDASACRTIERWAWEMLLFQRFALRPEEREDVVQETITRVWQEVTRPGFRLRRGLKPFVYRVAASRAIDCLRRRRPTVEVDESLVDPRPNPYEGTLRRDEAARLRWALQNLEPACREIIRLHVEQDLPYAEIAARQQRSEATMRVRMFNCLKTLRQIMARWA